MHRTTSFLLTLLSIAFSNAASINKFESLKDDDYWFNPIVKSDYDVEDQEYWDYHASYHISSMLEGRQQPTKGFARNLVIFIGDGMGATTTTAGRIYKGQRERNTSAEFFQLTFEEFPYVALSKTYSADKQVTDSAASATAMFTGAKTNQKVIGLDATNKMGVYHESSFYNGRLRTIMDWAQDAGKQTGFVTTTRVTHATPAGTYAHTPHRDWECDSAIPKRYRNKVKDIAKQLVQDETGRGFNIILGGGQEMFHYKSPPLNSVPVCPRMDKTNLVQEWLKLHASNDSYFVEDYDSLNRVPKNALNLLGLFSWSHLPYEIVRKKEAPTVPSLSQMTEKAIEILEHHNRGYVLMIEGGLIDVAHHDNMARASLEEVSEFDNAVRRAYELCSKETLIVVTSDHSHPFTFSGYPLRGNDILGFSNDTLSSLTLAYNNGPGFNYHYNIESPLLGYPWRNLTTDDTRMKNPYYEHQSMFYLSESHHGGEDVPVYAYGPASDIFSGVIEQSYIAHLISYSLCIGPSAYKNVNCDRKPSTRSASITSKSNILLLVVLIYLVTLKL